MFSSLRKKSRAGGKGASGGGAKGAGGASGGAGAGSAIQGETLMDLPAFRDVAVGERPELFRRKLLLCRETYNFHDAGADVREKEAKRQTLLSLVDYANSTKNVFVEGVFRDIVDMVAANLFRTLPPRDEDGFDPDEEEPVLEAAWPHLQIVYEFLLRFVVSSEVDAKVAKRYINHAFILSLLDLFESEDPRERDYLKTILHRIYGKYMALRSFIRRAINNVFFRVMYERERHNGVGELLEILGSIINGFALPLKAEHKRFLQRALIPLHKAQNVQLFHQQLSYCITQFVEKDPNVAVGVVRGLLKYWPHTSSHKQVLFLNELEEILELVQPPEFAKLMEALFGRIADCIGCPHFQVAERALFLWNNEYLVSLVAQNRHAVLPLVYGVLSDNKNHWNQTVANLAYNVLKLFMEMDQALFDEVKNEHEVTQDQKEKRKAETEAEWESLLKEAAAMEAEGNHK